MKERDCASTYVVYKMKCKKCNEFYIGSTWRRLHQRIKEHKTIKSSLVFQHRCKDSWENSILYKTNHVQKMRFMEAIMIRDLKPMVNGKETIYSGHIVI
jgi:predicted transposase YbfD/YdcC